MVALLHLHGIAQRTGGAGHDGDLLHRGGIGLLGRHQRVADLVVGHDMLLVIGHNGVLLLVAGNDYLDALLQVGLGGEAASVTDGAEGGLVDDVGQLGAGGTGGHTGDLVEVHVLGDLDLFGVYLQNGLAPQQVGQLHGYTAVETTGSGQGRIKGFGTVGGGQNDDAGVALEAVHLGEQLVQRLLALVVAAELGVSRAADGVDLVDEDDGRGDLRRLLEQIAHAARADADKHFHEIRAGDGEKRHVRLARDGLGQQRLAGARRADQQCALRELRADGGIFLRVMQEIDDLDKRFLGLVLTGDVGKRDAGRLFHIDLGLALADAADAAAHALGHAAHQQAEQGVHDDDRQQPCDDKGHDGAGLLNDLGVVDDALLVQLRLELGIIVVGDDAGVVHPLLRSGLFGLLPRQDDDPVRLELQLRDLVLVEILLEFVVRDLRQIGVGDGGIDGIDEQRGNERRDHQKDDPSALPSIVAVLRLIVLRLFALGVVIQKRTFFLRKTWENLVLFFLFQILSHPPGFYKKEPAAGR